MPAARSAAGRLAANGEVEVTQGGDGRRRRHSARTRAHPPPPLTRDRSSMPTRVSRGTRSGVAGGALEQRGRPGGRRSGASPARCRSAGRRGWPAAARLIRHRSSASRATTCTSRSATPDSPITSSTSGMSARRAADLGQAALHDLHRHVRAEPVAEGLGPHPTVQRRQRAVALQPGQPRLHGVAGQPEPLRQRHDARPGVLAQGEQQPGVGGVHIGHAAQSDMRGRPTTGLSAQSVRGILRRSVPGWCCPTTGWSCHHVWSGATPRCHETSTTADGRRPRRRGRRRGELRDRVGQGHRGGRPRTRGRRARTCPSSRTWSSCSPPRASGSSTPTTPSTSPTTSCAASTATWSSSASSTPRRPRCSARASWASGPACSARRPRRSAPAGRCGPRTWPSRPTASTASPTAAASTRSCRWACSAASTRAAGTRTRTSSTCTRSSSARRRLHATGYAMGIAMDGKDGATTARRHRLLRRRRHQPGRRQRGVHLRGQRLQRADRLLLPEQPVRDLRAAGAPDPGPALPARRRLRLPRRPGRRQRRARLLRGDPRGAGQRPPRPGPDPDRGVHLPDGRAHHLRRPDPLPHRQRGRGVAGQGPDRPAARPSWSSSGIADDAFFAEVDEPRPTSSAARLRERVLSTCPTRSR